MSTTYNVTINYQTKASSPARAAVIATSELNRMMSTAVGVVVHTQDMDGQTTSLLVTQEMADKWSAIDI